jgi:hypothetical protein
LALRKTMSRRGTTAMKNRPTFRLVQCPYLCWLYIPDYLGIEEDHK